MGKIIFNDFFEWIIFTLDYFKKNNIKVVLKPHQILILFIQKIKKIIEYLKKKYNNFIFLDPKYPNKKIFKKLKLAISPWGSVIWELAYFNIPCISIGDNPGKVYNLSLIPKNIKEYRYFLDNYKKVWKNIKKEKIYEFIYVYMLNNNDTYSNSARKMNLKKVDLTNTEGLKIFVEKFKQMKLDKNSLK